MALDSLADLLLQRENNRNGVAGDVISGRNLVHSSLFQCENQRVHSSASKSPASESRRSFRASDGNIGNQPGSFMPFPMAEPRYSFWCYCFWRRNQGVLSVLAMVISVNKLVYSFLVTRPPYFYGVGIKVFIIGCLS